MGNKTSKPTAKTASAGSGGGGGARRMQNFLVVWLDGNIDEVKNKDCINTISQLRAVANNVNTFTDVDECVRFISSIKQEKTFMISSGAMGPTTVPIVHPMPQVNTIYIFCGNKTRHEQWTKDWSKVEGVFTDIKPICEALRAAVQQCEQNMVSLSFVAPTTGASKQGLDELDQSFMYTQLLKEILLTIDFEQLHINQFIHYCQEQFAGNHQELDNIDKLKRKYRKHVPIWWYTHPGYLYSMLNRALRLMEVDLIIMMGFFIRDLHQDIAALHTQQYGSHGHSDSFVVYRGQGLSQADFDQLMKTKGGLLSFNNFLSTSMTPQVSLDFVQGTLQTTDLVGILFVMKIDPSIKFSTFANVSAVSYYKTEDEILFSMHSIFRIGEIKQVAGNTRLWEVGLTLTADNDPQLQALTECIREDTFPDLKGWYRLGTLLNRLGQSEQAQQVFEIMLGQKVNDREKAGIHHSLGMVKEAQGKYDEAIAAFQIANEINQAHSSCSQDLATSYSCIGVAYDNMGEYSKAVSSHEKALEIRQKTLPPNHPDLAQSYNNIGLVYHSMGEYSKALSSYEKALETEQITLPHNHPSLATSYNNIGSVYNDMGEYSKALLSHEKALKIRQKTLPPNHPDLAQSYNNVGLVYHSMGEYSKALSSYEKALETEQKALLPNHPSLATSYNNIGSVYNKMGEHSKALLSHEKALEIRQKTLPQNHPDLAQSYNNIGGVNDSMGEYSKALSSHEKALEIRQKTLPPNHPDLATSYSCIGVAYDNMGEYSKALSSHEKALEIRQKSLPPDHPDLATSCNNIGVVYSEMGEYSKALSLHEKSLEIRQKTLPQHHPDLATCYNNIGGVYEEMSEHSKALSSYEKALEIRQKSLPPNHPDLAASYGNIGVVYSEMGEYSKAFSASEKALEIRQKTLPPNHPSVAISYHNIGLVYYKMDNYSKALSYFDGALDIGQRSLPANHPNLQTIKKWIEVVKEKL